MVNRERRKNAGKRMAILGKKMEEEDDAFWSHETWAEDEDSGNESFRESDEDSALRKDVFDSDFNDSESDNEDEEVAAGEAEERELMKSERAKRNQNTYKMPGAKHPGGQKRRRGFPGANKRVLGEGFNAGIVLNLPHESFDSLSYFESISEKRKTFQPLEQMQQSTPLLPTDMKTASTPLLEHQPPPSVQLPPSSTLSTSTKSTSKAKTKPSFVPVRKATRSMQVSSRESRSTHGARKKREVSSSRRGDSTTRQKTPTSKTAVASKRKRYSQEELLLEAVHDTELENRRWLHGRKRVQDQYNREKDSNLSGLRDKNKGKNIIQKFHSRRGCLITLTYPEMDSVPEILTRQHQSINQQHRSQQLNRCVITGKIGKYKDPLTKQPYHNIDAFKELRRRHKEGIPIVNVRAVTNMKKESKNKGKMLCASSQPSSVKKTSLPKSEMKEQSAQVADGSKSRKKTTSNRMEPKDESSAINTHHKLPFQSPKPPQKLIDNGSKSQSKSAESSKPHPSDATSQQQISCIEKLAFSWGSKSNLSVQNNNTNAPISPGGRRLSPRQRKPSEKVLEAIASQSGKDDGIKPFSTSSLLNHQKAGNSKNKNLIGHSSSSEVAIVMPESNVPQPIGFQIPSVDGT